MKQKLHIFMTLLLLIICGGVSFGQNSTVTDELTPTSFGLKAGSYQDFTATYSSGAKYVGHFFGITTKFQMNSSKKKGIVTTVSAGTVKSIKIEFDSSNKNAVNVYGKNTAYSATGDINSSATQGTLIKKVDNSTTAVTITPSTKYQYVALASDNGALYISKITIEWETGSSDKTSTKLSFGTDYDGKTVSIKAGETLETPATLTPAVSGATISYDSSDKTVAEIDLDGIVYAYKEGTTIITASYAGDDTYAASSVSYTLNVEDARTATTLTFPTSSYTFGQGDQKGTAVIEDNAAILTPDGAGKVTYSVTGTDGLADVIEDGSVLVNTNVLGTATITASFAGNDTYKPSEASYTIEVKPLQETFNFKDGTDDYDSGLNPSKSTTYIKSSTWVAGNVTITTSGGNGIRWWQASDGNELRVYQNTKFAISVPDGYIITNIDLGVYGSMTVDCGTLNNSKWTGASQVVTITPSATKNIKNITVKYAKCETLTTAASGFATYAADYDVDYSAAGLKAYAITLDDAAKIVKYTEATGVVPAGKAVLVKGESKKEYTLAPATEEADATFTTDLQISDGKVTTEGSLYYAFATVDGKSGFKKLADGLTIPAKKGYLKLSAASAKGFFAFDETTTGINEIEAEATQNNAAIYNLAGQRVSKDYKGVVIKNGKKFLNK